MALLTVNLPVYHNVALSEWSAFMKRRHTDVLLKDGACVGCEKEYSYEAGAVAERKGKRWTTCVAAAGECQMWYNICPGCVGQVNRDHRKETRDDRYDEGRSTEVWLSEMKHTAIDYSRLWARCN